MKQFRYIFSFEYKSYVCNKVFVVLTVISILFMAVVLFFPRFSAGKDISLPSISDTAPKTIAIASTCSDSAKDVAGYLQPGFQKPL